MPIRTRLLLSCLAVFVLTAPALGETRQTAKPAQAGALTGNAVRGADTYEASCSGCHSLDENRIGPAHRGVVGRKAGAAKDFAYSPALLKSKITWTPARLDAWLAGPRKLVPGARMAFQLNDAQQRADVIAYLAAEGKKPAP